MILSSRSRMGILVSPIAFVTIIGGLLAALAQRGAVSHAARTHESSHPHIDCAESPLCTDVWNPTAFGPDYKYVGHDEPSNMFYSNVPGSGNRNLWFVKLPSDPTPGPGGVPKAGQTFNFELHPAFWFGMAMCDTQSYPEQVSTCTPDSDSNIVDPAVSAKHPGTAFMEMQFYPPGWASFASPDGISCDPTKWCAALNIDSYSNNPVTGQNNNSACLASAGVEYVNFAFITKSGVSQAPASPLLATAATLTPDPTKDLFMNSGDTITVKMRDTPSGLRIDILDLTTDQHGSMTASAANGFGQVLFAPTASTCTNIPYNFHPMYSTSSEQTRVPWAAHSYNIAFADEIGHFDFCSSVETSTGTCSGLEGRVGDQEKADVDNVGCLPASQSLLIQVSGCVGQNDGFDGVPYLKGTWPGGRFALNPNHPTPIQFSSPLTGFRFNTPYSRSAFEADLPNIEAAAPGSANHCIRSGPKAGIGCLLFPLTDDGTPAPFYPYFSSTKTTLHLDDQLNIPLCVWQFGDHIPGSITDFGRNKQYGSFLNLAYTSRGGKPIHLIEDFRQILNQNPC